MLESKWFSRYKEEKGIQILGAIKAKTCQNLAHDWKAVDRMKKKEERITLRVF